MPIRPILNIYAVVVLACALISTRTSFGDDATDPRGCLLRWLGNVKKMDSCSYSVKETSTASSFDSSDPYEMDQVDWVRSNDGRYASITHRWADVSSTFTVPDPKKCYIMKIVNRPGLGDLQLLDLVQRYPMKQGSQPHVSVAALPIEEADAIRHGDDGSLDGYWLGSKPAPEYFLARLSKMTVRRDDSKGAPCVVFDDKNEFGRCQFWLDLSHGCNPVCFEIDAAAGDLSPGGIHAMRIPYPDLGADGTTRQVIHERAVGTDFHYTMVDGIWVTSKCSVESEEDFADNSQKTGARRWWERTNLSFHPDFARAFDLDVPDQTPFLKENQGGIRYVWKDGAIVAKADDPTVRAIDAVVRSAGQSLLYPPPIFVRILRLRPCADPSISRISAAKLRLV